MKLILLALAPSILLQVATSSPRDLLSLQRPLTEYLSNLTTRVRQVTAREPGPRDAAMARSSDASLRLGVEK